MDTAQDIGRFIQEELAVPGGTTLHSDTALWGSVIDSLGLVRLVAFLEERYGIQISDDELTSAHFGTLSDIAAFVERRGGSG